MAEQKRGGPRGHGPQGHGFQRPKDFRGTVSKLLRYIGRYKAALAVVFVCLVISSVGSVMSSYLLKPIINDYILVGDFAGLLKMLVVLGGLFALSAGCSYAYARIMVHVAQRTVAAIRQDLFDHLQALPISYYDRHQSGDLMSRFTNDIDTVSEMLNSSFASIISNVLTFVGTVLMMIVLNPWLTLITFGFLALMGGVVKVIGGRSRVNFQRQQAALGAVNGYIEEMIEGQKVIKVFNHEKQAIGQFTTLNDTYRQAATAAQAYAGMMMPAMGNLSKINYAVTCCVGGLLAIGGVFDVGSLGAYLLYVKQVSQPVGQISQQVNTLLAAAAGAERIFAVMDAQPETDEGKTVIVRVEKDGDTLTETAQRTGRCAWKKPDGTLVELRGDVRFDHVTFSYDGENPVLSDICMHAGKGEIIGIVGESGCGKSTFLKLLLRFWQKNRGTIAYNGTDIDRIDGASLLDNVTMVSQTTYLFDESIEDNLRIAKPEATQQEIEEACRMASIHDFVMSLPEGYKTRVGALGDNLSAGEKQRLGLARAFLRGSSLILLDEPTSNVDSINEGIILKALREQKRSRSIILVSHRESTMAVADRVYRVEKGIMHEC